MKITDYILASLYMHLSSNHNLNIKISKTEISSSEDKTKQVLHHKFA